MKEKLSRISEVKNLVFFAVLGIISLLGLLWFLRPTESQLEKRELTEFPEFTIEGLLDGSYTAGISQWYADTFPLREYTVQANAWFKSLYGDQSETITLDHPQGDAIPSIPGNNDRPDPTIAPPAETTAPPEHSSAPEPTEAPAETETPPAETETPSSETETPPAETEAPPEHSAAPEATDVPASAAPTEFIETVAPVETPAPTNTPETFETVPPTNPPEIDPTPAPTQSGQAPTGQLMGSVYVSNDSGYSLYYFSRAGAEAYADFMNRTHQKLGDDVQLYSLVCPLSSGVILDQSLQDATEESNQGDAIAYMNSLMDPGIHALNVFDTLCAHKDEYIYFRTDHHWTALGAYYAYTDFCKSKGIEPHTLDQFEQMEFPGYLGSFYSNTLSTGMESNPDTVYAYVPMGTNSMVFQNTDGSESNWYVVLNVSNWNKFSKYNTFAGSDHPFSYVHNPEITDGSAVLMIKDSYGNAFVPFLVDHYEYIYWVDFRQFKGNIVDLVKEKDIDDVIFCLNIYNPNNTSVVKELDQLTQ